MIGEIPQKPLVILAAVSMELNPLRRRLPLLQVISRRRPLKLELRHSPLGPVLLGLTGIGRERATEAVRYLLEKYTPAAIFSVGFAGALQKNLKVGDVVFADGYYAISDFEPLKLEKIGWPSLPHEMLDCFNSHGLWSLGSWHRGALISSPKIITQAATKKRLGTEDTASMALGVEMETAATLQVLNEMGLQSLPFFSFRTISDTLDEDLNVDFDKIQTAKGRFKGFSTLAYFLKEPRAAWRLRRLVNQAQIAAESLGTQIYALLDHPRLWKAIH